MKLFSVDLRAFIEFFGSRFKNLRLISHYFVSYIKGVTIMINKELNKS